MMNFEATLPNTSTTHTQFQPFPTTGSSSLDTYNIPSNGILRATNTIISFLQQNPNRMSTKLSDDVQPILMEYY